MNVPMQSSPSGRNQTVPLPAGGTASSSTPQTTSSQQEDAHGSHDRPQSPLRTSSTRRNRLPSRPSVSQINGEDAKIDQPSETHKQAGRPRSSSSPHPTHSSTALHRTLSGQRTGDFLMPSVKEEASRPAAASLQVPFRSSKTPGRRRRVTTSALSDRGLERLGRPPRSRTDRTSEYEPSVVELLDVVDPEISTLSTLTNVQNSLFVPNLGRFVNRQPTYDFDWSLTNTAERGTPESEPSAASYIMTSSQREEDHQAHNARSGTEPSRIYSHSISSKLSETNWAVLPHDVSLDGWRKEDKAALNDHVRHMLHSRRSRFKRGLRGFGKYIRKPLGFCVTLYAVLITLFGLAWVLFLIGWIYVGDRQPYVIHVIDSVLVAFFALNGDVLAPFRARDTYHMVIIAHYHRLTWRLRRERALPKLQDKNDLPGKFSKEVDVESAPKNKDETVVLTLQQQEKLRYHQNKFSKSHSFYKPHEPLTHTAFPLRLLVAVVVLLDFHSCFQIALGACTWGISYHVRPQALTAVILSLSITCNIAAGIIISVGDRMTRKKEVIKRLSRQALTEEAMLQIKPDLAMHNLRNKQDDDPDQEMGSRSATPKCEPNRPRSEDTDPKPKEENMKSGLKLRRVILNPRRRVHRAGLHELDGYSGVQFE